jgi:S1-C subfamily serine protease
MLNRLQLASLPGDVGGPVIDASGAVLGMLLPGVAANNGRTLPDDVQFSLAGPVLRDTLTQLGLSPRNTSAQPNLPAEQLTDKAAQMTVLVNCWE